MRFVCVSDTHMSGPKIKMPAGDVLLHSGDHTFKGTEKETKQALEWVESLEYPTKIIIAGNHDFFFDPNAPKRFRGWSLYKYYSLHEMLAKYQSITYLCDSSIQIEKFKIYGSPWVKYFWQPYGEQWAFNFSSDPLKGLHEAENKWNEIPEDTNILLTHMPPSDILASRYKTYDERDGDSLLRKRLEQLKSLKLHVFGHLHAGYGIENLEFEDGRNTIFVNAAINTSDYDPINLPIVIDL